MPKRSNQFQRLAAVVHSRLAAGWIVSESLLLADKITGDPREVDVVATNNVMGHQLYLCVECRDHTRPADVTWVEQMAQKHSNLPTSKLVLWSRSGFTKSAAKKAEHLSIDLVPGGNIHRYDWAKVAQSMAGGHLQLVTPTLTAFLDVRRADGSYRRIEDAADVDLFDSEGQLLGVPRQLQHVILSNESARTAVLDHAPLGKGNFWIQFCPPSGVTFHVRTPDGDLEIVDRLGFGMTTLREHPPIEGAASVLQGDKVITLGSAKRQNGSTVELYVEESSIGSPKVDAREFPSSERTNEA